MIYHYIFTTRRLPLGILFVREPYLPVALGLVCNNEPLDAPKTYICFKKAEVFVWVLERFNLLRKRVLATSMLLTLWWVIMEISFVRISR